MIQLTLLYDGGCPLCLREVRFLERRDRRLHPEQPRLGFVDIDAPGYGAEAHGGISYREAMGRIHAIAADGTVLRDVAVFRQAYALVGLGWLYAPTTWPLLAPLVNGLYGLWASARLRLTGRPSLEQLCTLQGGRCAAPAETPGVRGIPRDAEVSVAGSSPVTVPLQKG
ncbi:MAG: thiol-disulfide oxidoreductase DCC family protein [Cyanobium sp.]